MKFIRQYVDYLKKVWNKESEGFGDTVAKLTKTFGIQPCDGCEKRRKLFNEKLRYRMKRKQPEAFIMPFYPMLGQKRFEARVIFPGWGKTGGAIHLETELYGVETSEEAENLLDEMVKALRDTVRLERCEENVGTKVDDEIRKEDEELRDRIKGIRQKTTEKK